MRDITLTLIYNRTEGSYHTQAESMPSREEAIRMLQEIAHEIPEFKDMNIDWNEVNDPTQFSIDFFNSTGTVLVRAKVEQGKDGMCGYFRENGPICGEVRLSDRIDINELLRYQESLKS